MYLLKIFIVLWLLSSSIFQYVVATELFINQFFEENFEYLFEGEQPFDLQENLKQGQYFNIVQKLTEKQILSCNEQFILSVAYHKLGILKQTFKILDEFENSKNCISHVKQRVTFYQYKVELFLDLNNLTKNELFGKYSELNHEQMNKQQIKSNFDLNIQEAKKHLIKAQDLLKNKTLKNTYPLLTAQQHILEAKYLLKKSRVNLFGSSFYSNKNNTDDLLYEAINKYDEVIQSLKNSKIKNINSSMMLAHALLSYVILDTSETDTWVNYSQELLLLLKQLPASHNKRVIMLNFVRSFLSRHSLQIITSFSDFPKSLIKPNGKPLRILQQLREILQEQFKEAKKYNDNFSIAYSLYYLAQFYAFEQRYADAIQVTKEALFYTDYIPSFKLGKNSIVNANHFSMLEPIEVKKPEVNKYIKHFIGDSSFQESKHSQIFFVRHSSELLYLLEKRLADLYVLNEDFDTAKAFYEKAVQHSLTPDMYCHSVTIEHTSNAKQLYFDAAKFALEQNDKEKAIKYIELFKQSELQDYFQDACVTKLKNKTINIKDKLPEYPRTAIFYPILFGNKLELFLIRRAMNKDSQIDRKTIPFEQKDYGNFLKYRNSLANDQTVNQNKDDLQKIANKFYKLLIEPIEGKLTGIDTLVIVANDELQNFPFASLYDEGTKKYLINKYAIATTPALRLTDLRKANNFNQILILGLDKKHGGSENMSQEINYISGLFGEYQVDILKNKQFKHNELKKKLQAKNYSIMHFATHGIFKPIAEHSSLRAYGENIYMQGLKQALSLTKFRDQPIELMVLSACSTAKSDSISSQKAFLGLSGSALAAGARSTLGTLWDIPDDLDNPSSKLIYRFYELLKAESDLTKAQVLQKAQQESIQQGASPHYWSPFILIGNWL
ncbi:CHAT domain-containing protein [Candidatus Albibeggiatoa sp. nov. NOAA]|uniref:CHAT domain-containing protein n=1 Tax=Candidatus Albibeggiatoa sp. nov. NOAA TaxID=3162724 RepID=UPI0032FBF756|nr:CHAT domain-containing protein [Thiotrichaceae bacterium]